MSVLKLEGRTCSKCETGTEELFEIKRTTGPVELETALRLQAFHSLVHLQTDNFHLHDEQTVNKLRKIA
jgi:hypothetical protein